jgi:signal transduction histidine kinase
MKEQQDRSVENIAQIRISKLQYLFALVAVIALISLGASSIFESRNAGSRSKILSNIETPAASIIFSQRETLVYATKLALWSNGGTSRREVQIARNLLAQRLAVVDSSGKSMGERASASYWKALKTADELVAAAPMGILPESLHRDTNKVLLPVIDQILSAARELVVSYQKSVDREMELYARDTAHRDSLNLLLLYLFIFSGTLALLLNIRGNFRNYRSAREALSIEMHRLDATQLRLAEAERTVTQLIDLDSAKNSLISTVNHELRTPLTSIIGYIELLRRDMTTKRPDEVANYLEVLERNSHILLRLVESLLSLSKFDGQEGRLPDEYVDLQAVLDSAIFTVTPSASAASLTITMEPSIPALVKGDVGQLNQVFINLLANAIKFTRGKSEILISMRRSSDSEIEISITDQGIGIAEEDIPRIFTRFYRAKNVESQGFEGFGLGLAIVQQAIEHHGGVIKVHSTLGKGSTFLVTLPLIEKSEES